MMTQDFNEQANCLQQRFAIAQREFDQYIEQQSLQITSLADNIEFQEIDGFYNFEATINQTIIATIWINTSEPSSFWVVESSGVEVFHCDRFSDAQDFVCNAYSNGSLQPSSSIAI
jgi:hypothetical protein